MDIKPIFVLPALKEYQEWGCEQGCTVHKPKLHKNVYLQQWDCKGNLIKELFEKYWTCQQGHLLMVFDNAANDYVSLPEHHYREAQ